MDDIRTVVHAMPALDLKTLYNNAAELSEGWNSLKDGRNQFSVDGERWMWRRVFAESVIEKYFVKGELDHVRDRGDIQRNQKNAEGYFRNVRRLKEESQALMHLSGGAPARATSLLSVQTESGCEGRGQRGILIENGMLPSS